MRYVENVLERLRPLPYHISATNSLIKGNSLAIIAPDLGAEISGVLFVATALDNGADAIIITSGCRSKKRWIELLVTAELPLFEIDSNGSAANPCVHIITSTSDGNPLTQASTKTTRPIWVLIHQPEFIVNDLRLNSDILFDLTKERRRKVSALSDNISWTQSGIWHVIHAMDISRMHVEIDGLSTSHIRNNLPVTDVITCALDHDLEIVRRRFETALQARLSLLKRCRIAKSSADETFFSNEDQHNPVHKITRISLAQHNPKVLVTAYREGNTILAMKRHLETGGSRATIGFIRSLTMGTQEDQELWKGLLSDQHISKAHASLLESHLRASPKFHMLRRMDTRTTSKEDTFTELTIVMVKSSFTKDALMGCLQTWGIPHVKSSHDDTIISTANRILVASDPNVIEKHIPQKVFVVDNHFRFWCDVRRHALRHHAHEMSISLIITENSLEWQDLLRQRTVYDAQLALIAESKRTLEKVPTAIHETDLFMEHQKNPHSQKTHYRRISHEMEVQQEGRNNRDPKSEIDRRPDPKNEDAAERQIKTQSTARHQLKENKQVANVENDRGISKIVIRLETLLPEPSPKGGAVADKVKMVLVRCQEHSHQELCDQEFRSCVENAGLDYDSCLDALAVLRMRGELYSPNSGVFILLV